MTMGDVFVKVLSMSLSAGVIVLAVLLVRLILKKVRSPKWIYCFMWMIVGLRLVCPWNPASSLGVLPDRDIVSAGRIDIVVEKQIEEPAADEAAITEEKKPFTYSAVVPVVSTGISTLDDSVNDSLRKSMAPLPGNSVDPYHVFSYIASIVWIVGIAGMLCYMFISVLMVKWRVREAVPYKGSTGTAAWGNGTGAGKDRSCRIFTTDKIASPFILGMFRPAIYLPASISEDSIEMVLAHEKAHLTRHDHWWKPIGFLILTVYWFNPLVWLAYVLLCRDIEMACDEKVLLQIGGESGARYSETLLRLSMPRRRITACPIAFGETGVKSRVKNVLNYKKPAFWIICVSVATVAVLGILFLTNRKTPANGNETPESVAEEPAKKNENEVEQKVQNGTEQDAVGKTENTASAAVFFNEENGSADYTDPLKIREYLGSLPSDPKELENKGVLLSMVASEYSDPDKAKQIWNSFADKVNAGHPALLTVAYVDEIFDSEDENAEGIRREFFDYLYYDGEKYYYCCDKRRAGTEDPGEIGLISMPLLFTEKTPGFDSSDKEIMRVLLTDRADMTQKRFASMIKYYGYEETGKSVPLFFSFNGSNGLTVIREYAEETQEYTDIQLSEAGFVTGRYVVTSNLFISPLSSSTFECGTEIYEFTEEGYSIIPISSPDGTPVRTEERVSENWEDFYTREEWSEFEKYTLWDVYDRLFSDVTYKKMSFADGHELYMDDGHLLLAEPGWVIRELKRLED